MNEEIKRNLTDRNWIKQSHELNQAQFTLSSLAFDILFLFLTEIRNEDTKFKSYQVTIAQLEKKLGKRINKKSLDTAISELLNSPLSVIDKKTGRILRTHWCSSVSYLPEFNDFEFSIDSKLEKYLLNMDDKLFSKTNFRGIVLIKGSYSKRLFSLLSQFGKSGYYKVSVDKLKYILDIEDKYKDYSDFKKRIISSTIKQMEEVMNITVTLVERKEGRKVVGLEFFLKHSEEKATKKQSANYKNQSEEALKEYFEDSQPQAEVQPVAPALPASPQNEEVIDVEAKTYKEILSDREAEKQAKREARKNSTKGLVSAVVSAADTLKK